MYIKKRIMGKKLAQKYYFRKNRDRINIFVHLLLLVY